MRVRNAVWRPPFVMYYRTCPLHAVRNDLTASGFTVTTVPLTALGRPEDGSPRYRLVLAGTGFSSREEPARPDCRVRRRTAHTRFLDEIARTLSLHIDIINEAESDD